MFLFLTTTIAGGVLIYAGIKGESETVNGTPLYKAPWNILLAPFTGGIIESSMTLGSSATNETVVLTTEQTVANPVQAVKAGLNTLATKVRAGSISIPQKVQST